MFREIMSNGFVVIIPILVWNGVLTSKLPTAFSRETFNHGTPYSILIGENLFRFAVFLMPIFLRITISTSIGSAGACVFLLGLALYFLSWLVLIYAPASRWSTSAFGFCAPAYTPVIWLAGISLMADSYYFDAVYIRWHFIVPAACFSLFHTLHTAHAYSRLGET
jgi:hypothetical protein